MLSSMSICLTEHAQKRIRIPPFVPDESRPKFACCCPRVQLVLEGPVAYSEGLFSCGGGKAGGCWWAEPGGGVTESDLLTKRWARMGVGCQERTGWGDLCMGVCACVCVHTYCAVYVCISTMHVYVCISTVHVCMCTSMCACVCVQRRPGQRKQVSNVLVVLSVEAGE